MTHNSWDVETGAGMSTDLSRRLISLCASWRGPLESSRPVNVFPPWRGSLYKVIILSGDGRVGSKKH